MYRKLSTNILRVRPSFQCQSSFPLNINARTWQSSSRLHHTLLTVDEDSMTEFAAGGVVCRQGDTVVHCAITTSSNYSPDSSLLPLTVDYKLNSYAYGMFPSTKSRRDKHGSEDEILVARVIDRSVRPLFDKGFLDNIQITTTLHAADNIHDPISTAVNATSLALTKASLPWNGPIGCVRVGIINGELKANPTVDEMKESKLDLLYSATADRCLMIEVMGDEIPEGTLKEALDIAHKNVQDIITQQKNLVSTNTSVPTFQRTFHSVPEELKVYLDEHKLPEVLDMFYNSRGLLRKERSKNEGKMNYELLQYLKQHETWSSLPSIVLNMASQNLMHKAYRKIAMNLYKPEESTTIKRLDGRDDATVRNVSMNMNHFPIVHGSAVFRRGDTHVLSVTTLGSLKNSKDMLIHDEMRNYQVIDESTMQSTAAVDNLLSADKDNFMLHYDFPSYATGDTESNGYLNRRMVGHGKLAEKALKFLIPSKHEYPYTIKLNCECTASNGSSSMASVCSGSLSLMSAGVPIKSLAAGVSIGLMTPADYNDVTETQEQSSNYLLLTDILGQEDHYGDMDFKIAGTYKGVTAMQLDVKLKGGIPNSILFEALEKAKTARHGILDKMKAHIDEKTALTVPHNSRPRAELIKFQTDRKRYLIGPGGETINYIRNQFNVDIDIIDTGAGVPTSNNAISMVDKPIEMSYVYIYGFNDRRVTEAKVLVQDIVSVVEEGSIFTAEILDVKDFGLTVKLTRSQEALLHVSELSHDPSVIKRELTEIFKAGQKLDVKVIYVDKATGLVKVSRKVLLSKEQSVPDTQILNPPPVPQVVDAEENASSISVVPPRKFNFEYFSKNVASASDIEKQNTAEKPKKPTHQKRYDQNNDSRPHHRSHNNGPSGVVHPRKVHHAPIEDQKHNYKKYTKHDGHKHSHQNQTQTPPAAESNNTQEATTEQSAEAKTPQDRKKRQPNNNNNKRKNTPADSNISSETEKKSSDSSALDDMIQNHKTNDSTTTTTV